MFAGEFLKRVEENIQAYQCFIDAEKSSLAERAYAPQNCTLSSVVEEALKRVDKFGLCSVGLLSLDKAGQPCSGFITWVGLFRPSLDATHQNFFKTCMALKICLP